jgi:hypothetical protein
VGTLWFKVPDVFVNGVLLGDFDGDLAWQRKVVSGMADISEENAEILMTK